MLFSWLKRRRRRRIMARPFPDSWLTHLSGNLAFFHGLNEEEKGRFLNDVKVFVHDRHWEGCGGLEMTDEIKVTIGGQACLLILGLHISHFDPVKTILVYPAQFYLKGRSALPTGEVLEGIQGRIGEAWFRGPVILSWTHSLRGCRHPGDGKNVVLHEFAHQLDMRDGYVDGTPPLQSREQYRVWRGVMQTEYERLISLCGGGRVTLLDTYGATNEGEFFAVSSECFFEKPRAMEQQHPELYDLLRKYYCQDPAARRKQGDR